MNVCLIVPENVWNIIDILFFKLKSIVDLQCCVNLCCTEKWFSYTDTHIYILFYILFQHCLSQDIEHRSQCYKVGPHFYGDWRTSLENSQLGFSYMNLRSSANLIELMSSHPNKEFFFWVISLPPLKRSNTVLLWYLFEGR